LQKRLDFKVDFGRFVRELRRRQQHRGNALLGLNEQPSGSLPVPAKSFAFGVPGYACVGPYLVVIRRATLFVDLFAGFAGFFGH
jgi:hypothetical protein